MFPVLNLQKNLRLARARPIVSPLAFSKKEETEPFLQNCIYLNIHYATYMRKTYYLANIQLYTELFITMYVYSALFVRRRTDILAFSFRERCVCFALRPIFVFARHHTSVHNIFNTPFKLNILSLLYICVYLRCSQVKYMADNKYKNMYPKISTRVRYQNCFTANSCSGDMCASYN